MKRKPDLLVVLVLLFGLGLAVSTYTHGNREESPVNTTISLSVKALP